MKAKTVIKRIIALTVAILMLAGSVSSIGAGLLEVKASAADELPETIEMNFRTRFFRYDSYNDCWVETYAAKKGEEIRARIYVGTSYYTSYMQITAFYNPEFFTDAYSTEEINNLYASADMEFAREEVINYQMRKLLPGSRFHQELIELGYMEPGEIDDKAAYMMSAEIGKTQAQLLNDREALFELNMTVREDTVLTEDSLLIPDKMICDYDYFDIPAGIVSTICTDPANKLSGIYIDEEYTRDRICTNYDLVTLSTVTKMYFDANEGRFSDNSIMYEAEYEIGSFTDGPENPVRDGYIFCGWALEPYVLPEDIINPPFEVIYEELIFKAIWEPSIFEIRYYLTKGDSVYYTESYREGDVIDQWFIEPPIMEGMTFVGWFDAGGNPLPDIMPSFNIDAYAQFAMNSHRVIFELQGGEFNNGLSNYEVEVAYGDEIPYYGHPIKEGYKFIGWADENGEFVEIPQYMPDRELVFTAVYEPIEYKFTLDAGGGEFSDGSEVYTEYVRYGNKTPDILAPSREGYEFIGWADENGYDVDCPIVMPANDVTLIAQYIPCDDIHYTVEIYVMYPDGTYSDYADEVLTLYGETDATAFYEPAEKSGFSVDYEHSTLEGIICSDGSTALKVYYERNIYRLTLDVLGELIITDYIYGEPVGLFDPPAREGYTFAGWTSENYEFVELPSTMPAQDVLLKAEFFVNEYICSFDCGYDYDVLEDMIVQFDSIIILPDAPEKEGYYFAFWANNNGEIYYAGSEFVMPAQDVVFTAVYEAAEDTPYTVEHYVMSVSGEYDITSERVEIYSGTTGVETEYVYPEKDGFCLDYEHSVTKEIINADGSTVLKIYYQRNRYTVTLDVNGEEREFDFYYGEEITLPEIEDTKDYNFHGWLDESGKKAEIPDLMPSRNLKYIAELYHRHEDKHSKYDVSASYYDGCFDEPVNIEVEELKKNNELGGYYFEDGKYHKQIKLYSIKMTNNKNEVCQPKNGEKVTLKIKIPDEYKKRADFTVYHWFTTGGREKFSTSKNDAWVENGYIYFNVGSFSEFALYVGSNVDLTKKPVKLAYNYKENIDLTGLVLTYTKADGTPIKITDTSVMRVEGYDSSKIGEQTVRVYYGNEPVEFKVTVQYAWWQMLIRILLLGFLWY